MPVIDFEDETEDAVERIEVKIDPETGLPVLPEDMFWRVGEIEELSYDRYYHPKEPRRDMVPAVQLIQTGRQVERIRKVPVYGEHWWNRNSIVSERKETYFDIEDVPVESAKFKGRQNYKKYLPDIAVNVSLNYGYTYSVSYPEGKDVPEENKIYDYDIPMNEEGIAFLADVVWRDYMSDSYDAAIREDQWRDASILKAQEKANQERLFGDYPPKKLERA